MDVFAGPGGLNEGFSSLLDDHHNPIFQTVNSFEMDQSAVNTLRLRAALRAVRRANGSNPSSYYEFLRGERTLESLESHSDFAAASRDAVNEVRRIELGDRTRAESDDILRRSLNGGEQGHWVLIGGPPCQAYSLAGRSRRTNDPNFTADHKHVLYREYIYMLRQHRPSVFVMENVKGMLSSQHDGGSIFQRILDDLRRPSDDVEYEIRSFILAGTDPTPRDLILRAEQFGVPQRRHRVILLGVRRDSGLGQHTLLSDSKYTTVSDAIGGLPAIRSLVSPRSQDSSDWFVEIRKAARQLARAPGSRFCPPLGDSFFPSKASDTPGSLGEWLTDKHLEGVVQHESRAHMPMDLMRYSYLAAMARQGHFPKVNELPEALVPNHRNASRVDAPFSDRFKVQRADAASATVVSHISKDGHYYIHPDPDQMRSLTVREAARLQTFPDDYFFTGNRTQQYHQVGNAVPPLLARQLGAIIATLLGRNVASTRL